MYRSQGVDDDVLARFTGDNEHDYALLMNFFCNEWRGRGCLVPLMPENYEAAAVFSRVGVNALPSEIKVTMELFEVADMSDCWERVNVLMSEFGRK